VAVTRAPYLQLATPNSMTIRWRTNIASDSRVWYGPAANSLTTNASDAVPTTEHLVTLSGLTPNTKYFYAVGTTTQGLAGGDAGHFFVTSPAAGTANPTRIWVLGDAGTGTTDQTRVRDAYYNFAGTSHTHLWLMLGDNAYDSGTDVEYQTKVFDVYSTMLRKSATWPALGNHDTAQATSAPASLPYFQIFSPPSAGQAGGVASGSKHYYSYNVGNIHFVVLDSMASARNVGGAMLNWLQSDLAANTKEWTIAYWHHPPYTKGAHDSDTDAESIEMRNNAMPLLESLGVDLVLSGHSHNYQRSYLIDGHYGTSSTFSAAMKKNGGSGRPAETGAYTKPLGVSSRQGTVYATVGSSGNVEGSPGVNHPAYFTTLFEVGSMVIDVNGTRLDATFLNADGVVRDTFTMIKGAPSNRAPSVALTAPAAGASATAPATINLAASASDSDGSIQRVEFYQGTTLLGSSTTAPYAFAWAGVAAGSYQLTAKAVDNLGAATTSAAVAFTVNAASTAQPLTLIGKGSAWKYLDNGTNQGTAWRSPTFNDGAWKSGVAQLGYGDGDEATVLSYGPNASSKYITTYFRKTFNVTNPAQFRSLLINLLRDDGAVVYLNGTELIRSNLPGGSISSATLASTSIVGADESTFYAFTLGTAALLAGTNVIAVEVHQATIDSSDLSFDLELIATP
jgi:acid phosphatase type 7